MLLFLLIACLHRPPAPEWCGLAEEHVVRAEDGAPIALHRHRAGGPPVLVVHGLSSNHRCWDLAPGRSLALALVEAGYDAWLVDLRGHGASRHARPRAKPGWTMDDYGVYDVKAAVDYVRASTGYDRVGYVGHSMGGLVAAIYQARWGDDALAALVVVGSPVEFRHPDALLRLSQRGFSMGSLVARVPSPAVSRAATPLGTRLPMNADELLFSSENLDAPSRRLMLRTVVSPLYKNELDQLARILDEERFVSADGSTDYGEALARLSAPLLVIAGRVDRVAPPDRVRPYYEAAGSEEKRYVLAGRANGFGADYGHLDLALGDRAEDEIFPLITGWFAGRWTSAAPAEDAPMSALPDPDAR